MVSLLSKAYAARPWTQRELDLFDLDADRSKRRLLGVDLDAISGPLDQVFQVHQRIRWSKPEFDPEAFWKLHCGLTNTRPGPRENWIDNGNTLINSPDYKCSMINTRKHLFGDSVVNPFIETDLVETDLVVQVERALDANNKNWVSDFSELRNMIIAIPFQRTLEHFIRTPWATGFSEFAAVIAMAAIPRKHHTISAWPFLDLSCSDIVAWFLMQDLLGSADTSEIWFSWAISQQAWNALPDAAARAPRRLAEHFAFLARPAVSADVSFEAIERDYDYGKMITPWNHFHLAWIASRVGNMNASREHACKLCFTTKLGDIRTARFLNRLTTWSVFAALRKDEHILVEIEGARQSLGMISLDDVPAIQHRLTDIWRHVLQGNCPLKTA